MGEYKEGEEDDDVDDNLILVGALLEADEKSLAILQILIVMIIFCSHEEADVVTRGKKSFASNLIRDDRGTMIHMSELLNLYIPPVVTAAVDFFTV